MITPAGMETFERLFTAEERELLSRTPGFPPSVLSGIAGGAAGGLVVFLALLLGLSFAPGGASIAPIGAVIGGAIAASGWYARRQSREGRVWSRLLLERSDALQTGVARVTRYQATDAIVVEQFEDEGPGCYLALTDGRVLFLGGRYLAEPVEQGGFPATEFEISHVANTGAFLTLVATGSYLAFSSSRRHSTSDYDQGWVPENETVLEVSFESLR